MKRERVIVIPDLRSTVDNGTCLVDEGVRKSRRVIDEGSQKLEDLMMTRLPSELLMNILLRLAAVDIMRCKCVCKELLNLVMAPEFVKSHLSQAVPAPGLLIYDWKTQERSYKLVEFVENLDRRCGVVLKFNPPSDVPILVHSSVKGLLFSKGRICSYNTKLIRTICNPITREYIKLPPPYKQTKTSSRLEFKTETCGFGVSRISGQHKVVRMYMAKRNSCTALSKHDTFDCQVYTVGTGSWRRIANYSCGRVIGCKEDGIGGAPLNGNLHWRGSTLEMERGMRKETEWISCFDLETEVFTTYSTPPRTSLDQTRALSVLGNCLCLCDNKWVGKDGYENIDIWLMKEYGDDKSWSKEFVIHSVNVHMEYRRLLRPIKVFEDGDILIEGDTLLYYCNKTKTTRKFNVSGLESKDQYVTSPIYTPSFVPLKTFAMEDVISY